MILYEAVTTYHILTAVLDRLSHKDQKAVLLLFDIKFSNLSTPLKKYLESLFEKVIPYNVGYANTHTEREVKKYFSKKLSTLSHIDQIICGAPQHSFGFYLAITNTPFVFCEEASGVLSRPQMLININNNYESRKNVNNIYQHLGLYSGENPNITAIKCNKKAQLQDFIFPSKKIINFDIIDQLNQLSSVERNSLFNAFFPPKEYCFPEDSVLLLTQHFANNLILTFEDQIYIYQLLIDYFFYNKKIIIKPHPDDILYYQKLFPHSTVIRDIFPSEFIPFLFSPKPKCVATISSTAIYNLRGHFNEVFELDDRFEKMFRFIHRYYIATLLAKSLNIELVSISANDLLIKQLIKTTGSTPAKTNSKLFIIDSFESEPNEIEISKKTISIINEQNETDGVAFINSKNDYCWYDYYRKDIWNYIVPIEIKKSIINPSKEDSYSDSEDEVIYVYSKNKEILHMAQELSESKNLSNTNVKIQVEKLTPEQERIKILEGMLAATEKRLLYYIEKSEKEEQ